MRGYHFLNREIEKRGIRKTVIARWLKISNRTLQNKIAGKTDFTWTEATSLQQQFFPDIDVETLLEAESTDKTA